MSLKDGEPIFNQLRPNTDAIAENMIAPYRFLTLSSTKKAEAIASSMLTPYETAADATKILIKKVSSLVQSTR